MTLETRIALFLVVELLAALRANDPDTLKLTTYALPLMPELMQQLSG